MQYANKHAIFQELFESKNVRTAVALPSHLERFIARLPPGYNHTVDHFIYNHTLFPYYEPFLPEERANRLRQDMYGSDGSTLYSRSGLTASTIPSIEQLRFCPLCVEEDRKQYGECYWHRIHQISGVEICPIHQIFIQDSKVYVHTLRTNNEFISAENVAEATIPSQIDRPEHKHSTPLNIEKDILASPAIAYAL